LSRSKPVASFRIPAAFAAALTLGYFPAFISSRTAGQSRAMRAREVFSVGTTPT
jgi:hypothetical protein